MLVSRTRAYLSPAGDSPRPVSYRLELDAFSLRHLLRSRQASTSDYNFEVNFIGDTNTRENSVEEVQAAKLAQNNERR